MACPESKQIMPFLDEQLTVAEAKRFEQHLYICMECESALADARDLVASIQSDGPFDMDDAAFVDGVLAATDMPIKRRTMRWAALAAGIAMTVLIPVLLFVQTESQNASVFTARGTPPTKLSAMVDAVPIVVRGDAIFRMDETTVLQPSDGLTFQYTHQFDGPVHFMAFAVDSNDEVHWFYPAYLSEAQDPVAVVLSKGKRDQLMPDIVQPEAVPEGTLRVIVLLSETRRTVKAVEKLIGQADKTGMEALFSKDDIFRQWQIQYRKPR